MNDGIIVALFIVTNFGSQYFYMLAIPALYWYNRRAGALFFSLFVTTTYLGIALKYLIDSPRPPIDTWLVPASDVEQLRGTPGFPSWHAMMAAAFWGLSSMKALDKKKWSIVVFGIVAALAIGISRLGLHVHYPIDVIGGLIIGFFVAAVFYFGEETLIQTFKSWDRGQGIYYSVFLPIFLFAAGMMLIQALDYKEIYSLAKLCGLASGLGLGIIFGPTISPPQNTGKWALRILTGMALSLFLYFLPLTVSFLLLNANANIVVEYIRTILFALSVTWFSPTIFERLNI